jgi:hypothetical protein
MMESWPSTLPQSPYHQHDGAQSSGMLNPDERLYPVRIRTYAEHAVTFQFRRLTVAQLQIFRTWWDVTLNQCASFTAPWLVSAGYEHHFCRFDAESPWEATMSGKRMDLNIKVEIIATMPEVDGLNAWYLPEEE